jgi:hypothetical protein
MMPETMTQLTLNGVGPAVPELIDAFPIIMADFRMDVGIQQRTALDQATVQEYCALYTEGRDLGRIVVFRDRYGTYFLADGFHRCQAAHMVGLETLPAEVHEGGYREALLYATSCNLHGKPLTNADKRKRVRTLLEDPDWGQWADNSIAKHCGVAQSFVSRMRTTLSHNSEISERHDARSRDSKSRDNQEAFSLHSEIREVQVATPGNAEARDPEIREVQVATPRDAEAREDTRRTYRDRYGEVRSMETSHIGRQPAEAVQEAVPAPPATSDGASTSTIARVTADVVRHLALLEAFSRATPRLMEAHGDAYQAVAEACTSFLALREPTAAPETKRVPQPTPSTPRASGKLTKRVLKAIKRREQFTCSEIAKQLGTEPRYVWRVLDRLTTQGTLTKEGSVYHVVDVSTRERS